MNSHSQFIDPHSILIVNKEGQLKRLYCPFTVRNLKYLGNIPPMTQMVVEEVKDSSKDLLIFIINGKPYPYDGFEILVES